VNNNEVKYFLDNYSLTAVTSMEMFTD